jgi:hypothetical protein
VYIDNKLVIYKTIMSIEGSPDNVEKIEKTERERMIEESSRVERASAEKNRLEYERGVKEGWSETLLNDRRGKMGFWNKKADIAEEKAVIYFDINEQAKKLSDDELEAEVKMANIRQRETHKRLTETKEAAAKNPSELMIEEVEEADKEAVKAAREFGAWQAAQKNRKSS